MTNEDEAESPRRIFNGCGHMYVEPLNHCSSLKTYLTPLFCKKVWQAVALSVQNTGHI